ncbi:MAG: hypothetical protein KF891_06190 [Rhizobacter sp.]|nr:hypothetical protein [Rhizobacter sp.]
MNPILGWALAFVAVIAGWQAYGWQGVVMVVSVIVFWLLLQFSRALRAMKNAASAPKGRVGSAVMLNAKLKAGMTLMQVITLTKSLGDRVSEAPETWAWADEGDSRVTLVFEGGKLQSWQLVRPEPPAD